MGKLNRTNLDQEHAIAAYRRVMAQHDAQTTAGGKLQYSGMAQSMRDLWKWWQGEDSLHEKAFGVAEK